MFSGIIEEVGTVTEITGQGQNKTFRIEAAMAPELHVDQSVSHNGVCLTVESIGSTGYTVTAIHETLEKTNLQDWQTGTFVNLERCLQMNGRLDGHIVQGHVDTTAQCVALSEQNGSWEYTFRFDPSHAHLVIEKGSIAINGVSLTVFDVTKDTFRVAIIPYTFAHTSFQSLKLQDLVNLEFDIIGKYITRMIQLREGSLQ